MSLCLPRASCFDTGLRSITHPFTVWDMNSLNKIVEGIKVKNLIWIPCPVTFKKVWRSFHSASHIRLGFQETCLCLALMHVPYMATLSTKHFSSWYLPRLLEEGIFPVPTNIFWKSDYLAPRLPPIFGVITALWTPGCNSCSHLYHSRPNWGKWQHIFVIFCPLDQIRLFQIRPPLLGFHYHDRSAASSNTDKRAQICSNIAPAYLWSHWVLCDV